MLLAVLASALGVLFLGQRLRFPFFSHAYSELLGNLFLNLRKCLREVIIGNRSKLKKGRKQKRGGM